MSQKLYEKYFAYDEEISEEQLKAEWHKRVGELRSLVQSPGWDALKKRLDDMIERSEIRAGAEQDMLYQIGKREALREMRDLFTVMEEELRHERQAGN